LTVPGLGLCAITRPTRRAFGRLVIRPTLQFARRIFVFAGPSLRPITCGTRQLAER